MWNFSTTGFVSAVEYSPRTKWDKKTKKLVSDDRFATQLPADYVPADDKNGVRSSHLLVRARVEADLDAVKPYDPEAIAFEDKTADYTFRLIIRRTAFAQFMYDQSMGIDYWSHVKETIDQRAPKVQGGRYGALMQIWSACSKWQPVRPYGGSWATPGYVSAVKPVKGSAVVDPKAQPLWPSRDGGRTFGHIFGDDDLFGLPATSVSRRTMEDQVSEILDEEGIEADVEDMTDRIQDLMGTVDLDGEDRDEIVAVIEEAVEETTADARTEPVSTYWRTSPTGTRHQVQGYKRSRAFQ